MSIAVDKVNQFDEELVDDPFFRRSDDAAWNACIGPQGQEENYVDGYIGAAALLADLVVERELYISLDTLVLPILYNARHAIELSLKFAIRRLHAEGILPEGVKPNHDITKHLAKLASAGMRDWALRMLVQRLNPYVQSLSSIDVDGQQLRYAQDQDGNASLGKRSLANLQIIRGSLADLGDVLQQLKYRVLAFCEENRTGTSTALCSRSDLAFIAQKLSSVHELRGPAFLEVKNRLKERFGLGNKTFQDAVTVIKANREFGVFLGRESTLKYLSDEKANFVVASWNKLHPPRVERKREARIVPNAELREMIRALPSEVPIALELIKALSVDELADVDTIFHIGRDGVLPEFYDNLFLSTRREYEVVRNHAVKVQHLLRKTNFLEALAKGLVRLGRPRLARELLATRPDLSEET